MEQKVKDLFTLIFCDAHVIDIDFYEWDRCVRLCVVGLDVESPVPSRLPLFIIEFRRVREFKCHFRHFGIELQDRKHHFQWNVHDSKVSHADNGEKIELIGSGVSPNLEILCDSVEITSLSHSILDSLYPNWHKPFGPLVRPSIKAMADGLNEQKEKN